MTTTVGCGLWRNGGTRMDTRRSRSREKRKVGSTTKRRSFFQDLFRKSVDATEEGKDVRDLESEEEFDRILEQAGDKPVVLSASMTYCGPCKIAKPRYQLMAEYYKNEAIFLAVEGDTNASTEKLLSRLGITAVPAYRVFLRGNNVSTDLTMPVGSVDADIKVLRSALLHALKHSKK